jgi:hypothetical protein
MWGCLNNGVGAWLRASGATGALAAGLWLPVATARAEPEAPHTETFIGFEASDNYTSGYVGGGYAFGKGLYEPGFRLRAVGSFSGYHYDGTLLQAGTYVPVTFDGEDAFLAALAGYQFRPGALIVKLFAGIEAEDQHIVPHDPNNSVQGRAVGLRLLAETWLDVSPKFFLSVDASYGTAFQEYCSLARVGYRVRPKLSLGLEGGALGNEEYDAGRGGGFVRGNLRTIEVTLSGGFTGNYLEDEPSLYIALGVYRPF